ncbi:MAG TPA: outer membrane beta-barrel protein [Nitrospiraceae bacterium]|nr:outer membrane beta-barrel protein [Nitrospiraceae bacterium]
MSFVHVAVFLLVLSWTPGLVSWASAEGYVAGHLGISLPDNWADVNATSLNAMGITPGARMSDLDLQNSLVYGAKLGYFTATRPWLGVEVEAYTSTPHISQQTVIAAVPGSATGGTLLGSHLRITTVAFNIMTRDTTYGDFQPYGGVGPALFITQSSGGVITETHAKLGLNIEAGGRYFLSKRFALFGEFKYNKVDSVKADGLRGDYSTQIFLGGVSFHFY